MATLQAETDYYEDVFILDKNFLLDWCIALLFRDKRNMLPPHGGYYS